jgi:NAD(P)-dependent dehydrogenase (short-subunit alcohol dehydrogenase family)
MSPTHPPPNYASKLTAQTALLIGGTGGVGLAVTHLLLQSGANVILTSSRESRLSSTLTTLRTQYPHLPVTAITGHVLDLSNPSIESNITTLFRTLNATSTTLHHILYMAGDRLPTTPISSITPESFATQTRVRALGPLLVIKHLLPLYPSPLTPACSFTLTSGSIASRPIPGGWSLLAFIGAGLTGLTRQLAFDLAPLRVNCVAPGVVDTEMWDYLGDKKGKWLEGLQGGTTTGRVGRAEDVAEAFGFVLRDGNVAGSVIESNGGCLVK